MSPETTRDRGAELLSIRGLSVSFATDGGKLHAVDDLSLDVPQGTVVALVGESGCGKSVTAQAALRLIPSPPGSIDAGEVRFEGRDLLKATARELRDVRGGRIGLVFQDPMTALNPVYSVAFQLVEAVRLHRKVSRREARARAIEGLRAVGFPEPAERIDAYPHELSGGMRQRVLIAMALACDPALLIADEPTTALDATLSAELLVLLRRIVDARGMSVLLIAHDLGAVASIADAVTVLYAGVVAEQGPTWAILRAPLHPYTRALLRSLPPLGPAAYRVRGQPPRTLPTIEGTLPDLRSPPLGCRFQDRCPHVMDRCRAEPPPLYPIRGLDGTLTHVRCFLVDPNAASYRSQPPPAGV